MPALLRRALPLKCSSATRSTANACGSSPTPTDELPEVAWIHYGRYLHERLSGKPTQYITRTQEFYGRAFQVTSGRTDSPP